MYSDKLRLPRLISDGCVLQQGKKTRIWGWCSPKDSVKVQLLDSSCMAAADHNGKWEALLENLTAGGPFQLHIETGSGDKVTVFDVYIGDVWICSGQSNMELPMERVEDLYPEEMGNCLNRSIRLFRVKEHYDFHAPIEGHTSGEWRESAPENIREFSAVSYFFGKYINADRMIPVGLINVSLGGSPAEAWMGKEALTAYPECLELIERYADDEFVASQIRKNIENAEEWRNRLLQAEQNMEVEEDWKEIAIPCFFEEAGIKDFVGSIWLRRTFRVSADMADESCRLWLGTMVDSDRTYINGVFVGETGYQYPPRKYRIPAGVLKPGENEILIRLICDNGKGRITPEKQYRIFTEKESVELSGTWEYSIRHRCEPAPEMDFISWKPTGLYNGMLAPCHPYMVKGVIWYQGESNTKNAGRYEEVLKKMISFWREKWKQDKLPFIIAQLPGFEIDLKKENSGWPIVREAQNRAGALEDVAVTVNLDLGEDNDLHPLNKKGVAYRMALAARKKVYHEDITWQGPVVKDWTIEEDKVKIVFDANDQGGISTKDEMDPEEFYMAGKDRIFYRADAEIDGLEILLSCEKVKQPAAVRYAWSNAPHNGLICNRSGLLASPFRTDNWE